MEIGVREILIVIVGVVIFAILLDGFRRAMDARKNSLKMNIKKVGEDDLDESLFNDYNPELPTGEFRIVKQADELMPQEPLSEVTVDTPSLEPSTMGDEQGFDAEERIAAEDSVLAPTVDDDLVLAEDGTIETLHPEVDVADASSKPEPVSKPQQRYQQEPEEFIVINLSSRQNLINGEDLLNTVSKNGLRFGDKGLFHRLDSLSDEDGGKLFSLVNLVKPGRFDIDTMADINTPGVCLFMSLPGPRAPRGAFETMLETARRMASALDCELRDESQSALTQQTVAHYRQRIDDFCRKQMAEGKKFDLVD